MRSFYEKERPDRGKHGATEHHAHYLFPVTSRPVVLSPMKTSSPLALVPVNSCTFPSPFLSLDPGNCTSSHHSFHFSASSTVLFDEDSLVSDNSFSLIASDSAKAAVTSFLSSVLAPLNFFETVSIRLASLMKTSVASPPSRLVLLVLASSRSC